MTLRLQTVTGWQRGAARARRLLCYVIDCVRLIAASRYARWRASQAPVAASNGNDKPGRTEPGARLSRRSGPNEKYKAYRQAGRGEAVNRDQVRTEWRQAQLTPAGSADSSGHRGTFRTGQRVLIVDVDLPRANRDSGSLRMHNILLLLRDLGCHVLFWPTAASGRDDCARALEREGIELVLTRRPVQTLRWWYTQGAALDVVILSRQPVALGAIRFARRYASRALLVFDTVDLHFLRMTRGAAVHGNSVEAALAEDMRRSELDLMRRTDLTLVVSEYERSLLHQLVPEVDVRVLSNIQPVHGGQASFAGRDGLLFLGNFQHAPNVDAVLWLISEIMPRLGERLPGATLHVVGYASDVALKDFAAANVHVHGFVADLEPILREVKLALAPLRYGAGVKGKINMAMSRGVPVVTTTVGAEGMGLVDRRDALIADDPVAFVQAIVDLYADERLWLGLSAQGLENVRRHFSPALARDVLREILAQAQVRADARSVRRQAGCS